MAYVITAPCVADYSCLDICPVEGCISPGPDDANFEKAEQLYINPDKCINCSACQDICPVDAIYKAELLPPKWQHYSEVNAQYFEHNSPTEDAK